MCGGYRWVSRVGRQRSSSSPSGINQDTENGNLPPSASSQAVACRRPRSAVALDACRLVHADQSLRCLPCFFARCSYVRRYRPLPLISPPPLPHQSLAPYSHSGSRHRGGYALLAPHGALHVDRSHRKAHTTPKRL